MLFPSQDFTDQFISESYQDVVQVYGNYLLDGYGNTIDFLNVTASVSLIAITQSIVSSSHADYADTSSITPFVGNRAIKRAPNAGLNVGGDNVVDFLNNFFFPFVPSTVSMGGTTLYETGSQQNFLVSATITVNDETIFGSGSISKDGVPAWYSASIPPYTFSKTDTGITENHSYVAYVSVDNNGSPTVINSSTKTATFIYPYLWGMSTTAGLNGTSLYNAFTRQVQTQGNKTVSLIGSTVYIYFCYPSSYSPLTSVLDPNLFEILSSFEYSASVPVTSSGLFNNWMANYKVYRTTLVADPNGNFQFKY